MSSVKYIARLILPSANRSTTINRALRHLCTAFMNSIVIVLRFLSRSFNVSKFTNSTISSRDSGAEKFSIISLITLWQLFPCLPIITATAR